MHFCIQTDDEISLGSGIINKSPPNCSLMSYLWAGRSSWVLCVRSRFSRVQRFVTPWTVARQAPLSTGFSRQEYWSGLPCPPPGDLPDPGMESASLMSPALAGRFIHERHLGSPFPSWDSRLLSVRDLPVLFTSG